MKKSSLEQKISFNEVSLSGDFDFSYMLDIERTKLKQFLKSWEEHNPGDKRPIRDFKICISLLDIIEGEDDDKWLEYLNLKRKVNIRNAKRFLRKLKPSEDAMYKLELYKTKAWYLYNLIRTYKLMSWWF